VLQFYEYSFLFFYSRLQVPSNMDNLTVDEQLACEKQANEQPDESPSQDLTPTGSTEDLDVEAMEDEASGDDSDDIDKMLNELQGFQEVRELINTYGFTLNVQMYI
jgi:hypothetical protein